MTKNVVTQKGQSRGPSWVRPKHLLHAQESGLGVDWDRLGRGICWCKQNLGVGRIRIGWVKLGLHALELGDWGQAQ